MRISALLLVLLSLLLSAGCPSQSPAQRVLWRDVMKKQAASNADPSSLDARQKYVDALAAFLKAYPDNPAAIALYQKEEVTYARELVRRGRLVAAIVYYESVLARHPENQELRGELDELRGKAVVTRDRFEELRKGMSMDDARAILGDPRPGWTHTIRKGNKVEETWYYKKEGGGVASVAFLDGKAFVAEYDGVIALEP